MTKNYLGLTAIVALLILFGSLYPFSFHRPPGHNIGAWNTLLASWDERPGRLDFLVNILFYMPLGFFAALGVRLRFWARVLIAAVFGGFLSTCVELSQYYDVGRVTSATDVYANTLGALAGGVVASVSPRNWRIPLLNEIRASPTPASLVAVWCGYRLYPYVPSIDLHKYWSAIKPIVLHPQLSLYDVLRHLVLWFTLFSLVELVAGRRRAMAVAAMFVGCISFGRFIIVDTTLNWPETVAGIVALCLWPVLLRFREKARLLLVFFALAAYVVTERLQPFHFFQYSRGFGWMPFRSFMVGSLQTNVLSFMEKTFLYGSLLFLLCTIGCRMWLAAFLVAGGLFATSWAEGFLPGRSAEITDTCMALLIAMGMSLQRSGSRDAVGDAAGPRAPDTSALTGQTGAPPHAAAKADTNGS